MLGFADRPGFGYPKLGKETKERLEETTERYLGRRRELALGVLLPGARPLTRRRCSGRYSNERVTIRRRATPERPGCLFICPIGEYFFAS